ATLVVNSPPAISNSPANQTVCAGQSATFMVTATGTSLTYQWRKNGTSISGATGSSYSIASVVSADAGSYDVVVSGTCSPATAASLTVNAPPAISNQPADRTACVGQTATFSVVATGTNLTYQWRKNGTNISGATGSSYTIASAVSADGGSYDVVVNGTCSPSA